MERTFVAEASSHLGQEIILKGIVYRLRVLSKTTFVSVKDCSGVVQCVGGTDTLKDHHLKLDDVISIIGKVRSEPRSRTGFEVDIVSLEVLNRSAHNLPFNSSTDLSAVGADVLIDYRPLTLRHERYERIFKLQAAIVNGFRSFLTKNRFTEIITSKIVAGGTEGGSNLFAIKYFETMAYLAQSPQFYKEHGVAGLERVFETGHVYRAEPHATSRHLTEYYSLDLEFGFIDGPEDVMQLERELLSDIFHRINTEHADTLKYFGQESLPSLLEVPSWEFGECLERLKSAYGRQDLIDDLDPEGERQLCELASKENGIPAVFVVGFPLSARPFYTHPRGSQGAAQSFDLLFRGLEITTGGQRLHTRKSLEESLSSRGIDPKTFESHLMAFDIGMPPHGGLAIGLERLTAQILGISNIRDVTMYPRDKHRIAP